MTENNIPTCERCGTPTIEEPSRELDKDFMPVMYQVCPLDPKDCELKALRSEVEALRKRNEELERQKNNAIEELRFLSSEAIPSLPYGDPIPCSLDTRREFDLMQAHLAAAESRAQEAETKLRAAEDAVVVLREVMGKLARYADTCELFLRKEYHGKAEALRERVEVAVDALSNTSALAAQRKREIQREAVEAAIKGVPT